MTYVRISNATFGGADPTWANACVGNNGNPQIYDYAAGYAAAANLLLERVLTQHQTEVDMYVYPICFNMRHAVELYIKASAVALTILSDLTARRIPVFDISGSHDIGKIWAHVKAHSTRFDARYETPVLALHEYISDMAEIDATGQVFRYPFDRGNIKHLTSVAIINLITLKERWAALEKLLKELRDINISLLGEYGLGAYTNNLSRVQLAIIARKLPPRGEWDTNAFDNAKQEIIKTYGISSREFSKALTIIQERRELPGIIEHAIPISSLSIGDLFIFFDAWSKYHDLERIFDPEKTTSEIRIVKIEPAAMLQSWAELRNLTSQLIKKLSPTAFAAIRSLYDFRSERQFSEIFERILTENLYSASRYSSAPGEYLEDAEELLCKYHALHNTINTLNYFGHHDKVNLVIERYDLTKYREHITASSELLLAMLVRGETMC